MTKAFVTEESQHIYCAYDELVSVKDLQKKAREDNPNVHGDGGEKLAFSMRNPEIGIRHPIVISKQSGKIVAGHKRLKAAMINGWKTFPVQYQDFASPDIEYAHVVADNTHGQDSEIDLSALNAALEGLGPELDTQLFGLKDFQIEPADKDAPKDSLVKESSKNRCPHCGKLID